MTNENMNNTTVKNEIDGDDFLTNDDFLIKFDLSEKDPPAVWIDFPNDDVFKESRREKVIDRLEDDTHSRSTRPPSVVDTSFEDSWMSDDDSLTISLYRPLVLDDETTLPTLGNGDTNATFFDPVCDSSTSDSAYELLKTIKRGYEICNAQIMGVVDKFSVVSQVDETSNTEETPKTETETTPDSGIEISIDSLTS